MQKMAIFILWSPSLSIQEIARYDSFLREVVNVVIEKYGGTLKAEHGTGRNMAPFVETEWGGDAYDIMKSLKQVIDPENLLNPGVIINEDRTAHISNLKDLPIVEEEVDRCIECGFCEHVCPSRDITTTPRRRIVIRRALKNLEKAGDSENHKILLQQYQYDGKETCAVDGLCAIACPVDINTGDLIKRLRRESHSANANRKALWIAKNFKSVEWVIRAGLKVGIGINNLLGKNTMFRLTKGVRNIVPAMPIWSNHLQAPARLAVLRSNEGLSKRKNHSGIVYFPACISRTIGTYKGRARNMMETFLNICDIAGIAVNVLDDVKGSCCSQIFSSKGFSDAYRFTSNKIVDQIWYSTRQGELPVVIDVSSCAYTLQQMRPMLDEARKVKYDSLKILDSIDFLHDMVMPVVKVKRRTNSIVLHPVCSLKKNENRKQIHTYSEAFCERGCGTQL
jgi:D-lactate dehydrogenase